MDLKKHFLVQQQFFFIFIGLFIANFFLVSSAPTKLTNSVVPSPNSQEYTSSYQILWNIIDESNEDSTENESESDESKISKEASEEMDTTPIFLPVVKKNRGVQELFSYHPGNSAHVISNPTIDGSAKFNRDTNYPGRPAGDGEKKHGRKFQTQGWK